MAHTRTDVEFRAQGDVTLRSWLYQPEGVDTVPKSAPWTNTPKALLALFSLCRTCGSVRTAVEVRNSVGLRINLS